MVLSKRLNFFVFRTAKGGIKIKTIAQFSVAEGRVSEALKGAFTIVIAE